MAENINISGRYGTHLAALISIMGKTGGDVLELGMGVFSTPYLHYQCTLSRRHLTSIDNDLFWIRFFERYQYPNEYHKITYVEAWDKADIEKAWDLALIDHSPDDRRIVEVRRLANLARYIVIHDSNDDKRHRSAFHYDDIYPLFKYKKLWNREACHATVLSNFLDLENLW